MIFGLFGGNKGPMVVYRDDGRNPVLDRGYGAEYIVSQREFLRRVGKGLVHCDSPLAVEVDSEGIPIMNGKEVLHGNATVILRQQAA